MSRFLLVAVLLLGGLIAASRLQRFLAREHPPAPMPVASALVTGSAAGGALAGLRQNAPVAPSPQVLETSTALAPPDPRVRLELRRRIARERLTTYLDSLFTITDSTIRHWPDRHGAPILISVTGQDLDGVGPQHQQILQEAVARWERLQLGLRFGWVLDTAASDIVVQWIDRFPLDRSGQADVQWTKDGRIFHARVTLALRTVGGFELPADALAAVATHEFGHALGMPHSGDPRDVMFPTTQTATLTARDRSTARLLYGLPTGSVKQ